MTERAGPGSHALTLPSVPQSVARVRRYAVDACRARGFEGDRDTLALLVSEVVTNALLHGTGEVQVRVLGEASRLRVEVSDGSDVMPVRRDSEADAEGGRGLALVDALSARWGADPRAGGKTVWFELLA